jgi:hypothetical protein
MLFPQRRFAVAAGCFSLFSTLLFHGCGWQKSRISAVLAETPAVLPWKSSDNSEACLQADE